jgi:hypothetical protein
VNGAGSFKVKYDMSRDIYSVGVSGWYFGKTAGLLGTYDNEPRNDMTTAYNQPTNNAYRLAYTWQTSHCW